MRKLTPVQRKNADTFIQAATGIAAAVPVILVGTGVNTAVGAGAVVLGVSVVITRVMSIPAVEAALDRWLGPDR
jgi:hypothetical protein